MRTFSLSAAFLVCLALHSLRAEAPAVEITAEPAHHLALENEWVRVFQVEVAPHAATLLHRQAILRQRIMAGQKVKKVNRCQGFVLGLCRSTGEAIQLASLTTQEDRT